MKTIWKYELSKWSPNSVIEMPEYSVPVHVATDGRGFPCVWVEVDTQSRMLKREFLAIGTGDSIPDQPVGRAMIYVGSYTIHHLGDWLIFHVYDLGFTVIYDLGFTVRGV